MFDSPSSRLSEYERVWRELEDLRDRRSEISQEYDRMIAATRLEIDESLTLIRQVSRMIMPIDHIYNSTERPEGAREI